MKNEYAAFVTALKKALLEKTGYTEDKIYFAEKGSRYAPSGDRLYVECREHEGAREVCGIYVRELYEQYLNEEKLEDITFRVLKEIRWVQNAGFLEQTKKLASYETAKNQLFIRLLNLEALKGERNHAVYRVLGDIALVLYMKVSEEEGCLTSLKVSPESIRKWGRQKEEVFEAALLNTAQISPPRVYFWEQLLYNPDYTGEVFLTEEGGEKLHRNAIGNCISTSCRTNGAVAIFLPGVAARIAEVLGADLYLAFTSIHEVMVHNAQEVEAENLREVLNKTIQNATPEEEFLSSQIFRYNRLTGEFSCVTKAGVPTYSNREC